MMHDIPVSFSKHAKWIMCVTAVATLLSFSGFSSAAAGESAEVAQKHRVGIMGGTAIYYGLDSVVSPRAYRGPLWGGALFYEYRGDRNLHLATVAGYVGSPKPRTPTVVGHRNNDNEVAVETPDPFVVRGKAQYAYHRILQSFDRAFWALGGALDAEINYFNATGFSWLAAYTANLSIMASWRIGSRHSLTVRLYTPLLTFLSRPAWSLFDDAVLDRPPATNLFVAKTTSVHEFARITGEARYEFSLSKHIKLGMVYEISYEHTEIPRDADIVLNTVALAVVPTF